MEKSITDRVAVYLAGMPEFVKGEYTIYSGVNPKCITCDGNTLQISNPDYYLELLICKDNLPLLQVTCTGTRTVLPKELHWLPRFCLPDEDDMEFTDIEEQPAYPSVKYLESFWMGIKRWLQLKYSSLNAVRRRASGMPPPEHILSAVPAEVILPGADRDALQQMLIKKRMLNQQGNPTAYTWSCGLFLRYRMDSSGQVQRELMTAVPVADALARTLTTEYSPLTTATLPLAQRISRLRENLPSDDHYAVTFLEELLQTPLEVLLIGKASTLKNVQEALAEASAYSRMFGITEAEKEFVCYRDCLELLFQLWPFLGEDPQTDSWEDSRLRKNCETILLGLSEPFLAKGPEHEEAPQPPMPAVQPLSQRLRQVNTGPGKLLVTRLPLIHYFSTAACMMGSDYPNWLYHIHFRELLSGRKEPESTFRFITIAQYCYEGYIDDSVDNWTDVFPPLYNLLVEPFSGLFVKTVAADPIQKER